MPIFGKVHTALVSNETSSASRERGSYVAKNHGHNRSVRHWGYCITEHQHGRPLRIMYPNPTSVPLSIFVW